MTSATELGYNVIAGKCVVHTSVAVSNVHAESEGKVFQDVQAYKHFT
jgi:hypothetical protein